jgi:hypothetical protein
MPTNIVSHTQKLVTTWFGGTILSVDHIFTWNSETCQLDYQKSVQNRQTLTFAGTGKKYTVIVTNGGTEVRECEDPPDTCQKVVRLFVRVYSQWVVAGTELGADVIFDDSIELATECLEECCE